MIVKSFFIVCMLLLTFASTCCYSSCYFYSAMGMRMIEKFTIPLSITLSVPAGTETGRSFFQQNIDIVNTPSNFWRMVWIKCPTKGQYWFNYDYAATHFPASPVNNKIYETGFPGVGIKFSVNGNDIPFRTPVAECSNTSDCRFPDGWQARSVVSLVKTQQTLSPGEISGNSLPTAIYQLGQSGKMINIYQIAFSGTIKITVPTCDIALASSNMAVAMGIENESAFAGPGQGTEWKDASIRLTNCQRFYGNSYDGSSGAKYDGRANTLTVSSNAIEITLTPLNGIEDAVKGIMKLAPHPEKASGIGIQLSSSRSAAGQINLLHPIRQLLPKDGSQTVTIPLFARYIQTTSHITPGISNGKLEYTVSYQ
jgi:major type 1 subunit fimbrin (pilin)